MGTSSFLLVANIFLAFYEYVKALSDLSMFFGYKNMGKILMYARYIDIIFFFFEDSQKSLMSTLDEIKFKSLHIIRNFLQTWQIFLDVELITLPILFKVRIQMRIYCKQMNKFQYIPWASTQNLSVKKTFVKTKLIRFITRCSQKRYDTKTTQLFYYNLCRRSYPARIFLSYFKPRSYSKYWAFWIPQKIEEANVPLLFFFNYNDIWEYINIKEVAEDIRKE